MPKTKENATEYLWNDEYIKCPHCDHERVDDLHEHMEENDEEKIQCERCGKTFVVQTEVTVMWNTYYVEEVE